jgi:hypothetical protein
MGLRSPVTIGEKYAQHPTPLLKIDPVTGAIVDPQIRDSCRNRPNIARISAKGTFNPGLMNALALRFRTPLSQR